MTLTNTAAGIVLILTIGLAESAFAQRGCGRCPWAASVNAATTQPSAEPTTQPTADRASLSAPAGRHRHGQQATASAEGEDAVRPNRAGGGAMRGQMRGQMRGRMGGAMRGGMNQVMGLIHNLLDQRGQIRRTVEEIPGGVMTLTTSDDPQIAQAIRQHVRQMKDRYASGQPIRMWDPLYAEMFAHREKIALDVQDVPGGVTVRHTSDDPQVTQLIRRHATTVGEFLAKGYERVHQPTTLPADDASAAPNRQ